MDEKTKADIYMEYLEQILAGKKDIEFVEDIEIEGLLLLAKAVIAADLSANSRIREKLKKQLLAKVTIGTSLYLTKNDDELGEEDLELVAAGFTNQAGEENKFCPYCGSKLKKFEGKCPFCSH
jgi:NADH pyrophosphatase NudC (nudix superfamily)